MVRTEIVNIGFISTRLAGTDGVSLETAKLAHVLRQMGHDIFYCAGELDGDVPGLLAPELHFVDETAVSLSHRAFHSASTDPHLLPDIHKQAQVLKRPIHQFIQQYHIQYLIIQNAFAIPMQLPLAQAITELLQETQLPALAHNHDFYWERERFRHSYIGQFLDSYFPPVLPKLKHAVINSAAQRDLKARRGLDSILIPNVFDFHTPAPGIDDYNADFRQAIGLTDEDWLILQPTRVVPRKGIELSIELLAQLDDPRAKLIITHHAGDEGIDYLHQLQELAQEKNVDLRYVADIVDDKRRKTADSGKTYALWDTYPHADLVAYPSLYEGFGNALIETIYFRLPALVNRYDVYIDDIAPHGFQFVEIDGAIMPQTVTQVKSLLQNKSSAQKIGQHNYELGKKHFSYQTLTHLIQPLIS